MMLKYIYIILFVFVFMSCKPSGDGDKLKDKISPIQNSVNQMVGIGIIKPEINIIQLYAPATGIVQALLKKEGDTVSIGTPIIELDHELEDAKVRQLSFEANAQADQVTSDEAAVSDYEAKYKNALVEMHRSEALLLKGAETQQTVDDERTNVTSLKSNRDRLQAAVLVSKSKWAQSKAALEVAVVERDQKIIKSPVSGKVLEVSAVIGEAVDTKESVAQIRPTGKTIVECEIDELYADKAQIGQKAWIRNVGATDTLATGTVYTTYGFLKKKSLFTDQAGEKEDRRVRTVKIMLDQPEKLLLNARVECVIDISQNIKK